MCETTVDCVCQNAVLTAYRELRHRNLPEVSAFETAVRVLRFHHPEFGPTAARDQAAAILDAAPAAH